LCTAKFNHFRKDMKMKTVKMFTILALGLMVSLAMVSKAAPMGTAFTYHGRLIDNSAPADGLYDFEFGLFDDPCTGNQQGSTIDINDTDIIDGYFTVDLNFGSDVFNGDARWLEILVRPGDSNDASDYVTLSPRQEVTPTPYALQTRGIFVDNSENIGMGTTSPKGKLHVDGGKAADDTDASDITIEAQEGGDGGGIIGDDGGNGGDIILLPGEGGDPREFGRRGRDGNVGIGTAAPEAMLDVRGNIKVDHKIQAYDSGGLELATDEGTTRIFVADDGKVGIGTTTPLASLEVTNTGGSHAIWASTSDIPVYAQRIATAGSWPAIAGDCNSETNNASGVRGRILSTSPGSLSAGVRGINNGTGATGAGVYGWQAGSGYGVYGSSNSGIGVYGESPGISGSGVYGYATGTLGKGVYGSSSGYGVYGSSSDGYGVYGISGTEYGYLGGNGYGVYGQDTDSGNYGYLGGSSRCVYGEHSSGNYGYLGDSSYGAYGKNNSSGNYGYLGDSSYGVYGKNNSSGNYGYLGGSRYGVFGYANSEYGVYGSSATGYGVYGASGLGYAGYFAGNVYMTKDVSALSFTDRTPYPKDIATAYEVVKSMGRLPDGQYDESDREAQLDHATLHDYIRSEDGNRDLSATVSCHNEVLKDLIVKQEELSKAHIYIEQLQKHNKLLEARLAKLEALIINQAGR
jgi:hypothetical protein